MRRSKAEVERYIASVQGAAPSPREKSMKGFFFAKLYYEAKEYELAKRYISSYLDVQERDPKALKFLGHLYEVEGLVDKAVGCYKSSVELNPTQKDLVLKIAELLCDKNADDGRAEYWVEKAAKLFPGSPAVYKLKEKLLNFKGDVGWNQLFDLIQSELYSRPDDVYVNIRLVELYRANKRLEEAVDHCLKAEKKGSLRASLEWCSCIVRILKEYLKSLQGLGPDKSMWRMLNQELLLAHCNLMLLTLSTKDVQECRRVFQSFDHVLQSVKPYTSGTDDLSVTFLEIRGHFYMHAGTLLLKMAQHSEAQWRAVTEPAALCYLIAFQVPKSKNKCIKGGENGPDLLEMLACDRRSQTGHMLRNLSHNKDDFLKGVVETFANKSGRNALFEVLFEKQTTLEQSFLGCDDIRDVESREPELAELARCDIGSIHFHYGNLHHLAWLGLQCHNKASPPAIRKWLKQLFPRLPQETARLDTNAPESICLLDLEVFLLAVIFESHLQLQDHFNTHYNSHQPRCLPLAICTPLGTERQKSWWDAVYNLIHKKTQPGASAKLRLLLQHELITLRALDKHGLQPAVIIHWARNLHKTGSCLNSYYDQKDYMVRCVHYWKKVLPLLESIKKKKSIPEPIDPFFKHFHSQDIQISEVADYEEEAQIAFASLDVVDGKFDDAVRTFDEIKNVVSYWNLARIFQRKAEDIENDAISPEEQEECTNCLQKSRDYLIKIIDESFADSTVAEKLPVSLESVKKMLDSVLQELGEYYEDEAPVFKIESSRIDAEIKHSTPSPTKFSISPNKSYKLSPKTPPRWVEDQKALLQMLCHQVEALKNEVQELKLNSNSNASPHRWPSESFGLEHVPDGYRGAQSSHGTPLTVSTSGSTGYYNQSPSYNSKYLLRTATNDIPTKVPVYGMNRLVPQQQMYTYQQQIQTPPLQSTSSCKFPRETFNTPMHYESPAPTLLSPRGDEYYNYSVSKSTANPPLPEPGYFTKPTIAQQSSDSKIEEFANTQFGQTIQTNEIKMSPFMKPSQATPSAFKFTSNFQSNDGDFTFSTPQFVAPNTGFTGSECLFSLLTSDKPFHDIHSGQKAVTSQTSDQRDFFNFGSKSLSGGSCAGNTAQTLDKTPSVFDRGDHAFSFQNPRMPVLVIPDTNPANVSHDSDRGSILGAEEDGPHFEPVVPLPDKVEVKTGEEDEEELFSNRAKLFRFDAELKEWKERGVGIVKILRHKKFGKMRLLMRREQVLKICANHYINPDMTLKPNAGSNKSYVWHALDYADEMPKPEQLAIRFKTPEEASLFKHKFEEAQKLLREMAYVGSPSQQGVGSSREAPNGDKGSDKSSAASANFGFQFTKKLGEWECDVCLVRNAATASACAACQTPKVSNKVKAAPVADAKIAFAVASGVPALPTFSFGKSATDATPASGFGGQFTKRQEEWDCEVCLVRNPATALVCVACQTAYPNVSSKIIAPIAVPRVRNANTAGAQPPPPFSFSNENTVSAAPATGFGEYLRKKKGQWECSVCLVTNEESAKICAACQTSTTTSSVSGTGQRASSSNIGPSVISSPAKIDFGARFSRKEGQWDCNVCLVRNEASSVICVSCLTPNPQVPAANTLAGPPASGFKFGSNTDKSILQPSGFGTQFLKKEGQWDCSVCLVRNESSLANCASCQTPNPHVKPGAAATPASSGFTFGLKSKLSEPASGKPGAESKSVFSGSGFKFGHAEQGQTSVPATGFGEHLRKKGQWDCNVCLVRNEETAEMCVACHTPSATVSLSGSDQQAALNKTGPASIPSSVKIDFGARFSRKEGQWDCNVCLVRNEASSVTCVSCLTPNPQVPSANTLAGPPASGFKFGSNTDKSILQPSGFGTQFLKKEGQWDCSVCLVRNESSLANCASCQTPNPCVKPGAPATPVSSGFTFGLKSKLSEPASGKLGAESKSVFSGSGFKFGQAEQGQTSVPATGFGQHSRKKKGHWDCGACLVPNEETAKTCVACQAPAATITLSGSVQQASSNKTGPASIPISVKTDIGARFSRKEGQWDCSVCLVRNEASSVSCAACQTPNPQSGTTTALSIHPASDFKFGSNTDTITLQPSAFGAQFSKKEGQWDCKVCLVRNESSLTNCASCQAPNPCVKTVPSAILASSAFTFGLKSKLCEPTGGKLEMESKSTFSESGFKFGHTEQVKTTSSMFQMPSFNPKSNPAKEGFSFAIPASSGGFKFGTQSLNKNGQQEELAKEKTASFHKGSANEQMVKPSENATVASHGESIKQNVFFDQNINTFSFATASESGFAKKDLHFKGISPTSKKPNSLTVEGSNASADQGKGDELYQTEDRDDIHFEPVVQLPEKIALVTGEEEEKTLYSERVKLFRFDADTSQWKERGVGNLKILRNELTGALRLLMRRDQVLKVCANHWITSTVNLKPLSGSDRAWMWLANDFSDGGAKLEQLAAKFKTPDQAQDFKYKFEESQRMFLALPPQTPHKLSESGGSAQVKVEEINVIDGKNIVLEQTTKLHDQSKNSGSMDHTSGLVSEPSTGPSFQFENLQKKVLGNNLSNTVYDSPSASTPVKKNLFSFGESAAGFNFSFQPVSPSKSPTKLNQSRVSVGTDEESDVTQEEERDGQYFEPVVPLPDLVEVSSGEENEQVLFGHRAKLYRFDKDANQWKERGIGDIKVLQNYDTKSVRIIMRRDQVFKLCANHRITPDLNLKPMAGTERAWVWTAHDFSEGEGKIELFAVRFKLQDVADSFQKVFDEAKQAQESNTLLTPVSPRGSTPKVSTCGKMAVAVLEETTRERTNLEREDDATPVASLIKSETSNSSETPTKTFVSPPKFVFGSDSVKNIFSSEKPKSFTFGSTSTTESMFGFNFNPLKSICEKKTPVTKNVTVKRLNFNTGAESQECATISEMPKNLNHLMPSSLKDSSGKETPEMPVEAENRKEAGAQSSSEDVFVVYELVPTSEQKALAESLQLPSTFFCYKNMPDYVSDDDQDDEDFETAVKNLNGRLYLDGRVSRAASKDHMKGDIVGANRTACIFTEVKAENVQFRPTSFCDVTDKGNCSQAVFGTVHGVKESQNQEVTSAADTVKIINLFEAVTSTITVKEETDSATESTHSSSWANYTPVDLSTKDQRHNAGSTSKGLENFDLYGFSSSTGQSFADLASNNSGDFAFGTTDKNFTWQNSGAVVFASLAAGKKGDDEDDSGGDDAENDDIHFEPIVSLPEVQVKSGEEDEEVLFKERTKMYRFDRDAGQWKERGVGEIKILYHAEKKYFRVLMRRDQVLKVCANHVISKSMDIQPLSTSNNALVWTATDYSDGEGRVEQLAVRFKTQDLADSFKMKFEECQKKLPELTDAS